MSRRGEVKVPRQKRARETVSKIVAAGYELFCEKGYFNTNTKEIAKRAGVSTGVLYDYFNDKKGIFLSWFEQYRSEIEEPVNNAINELDDDAELIEIINIIMDVMVQSHSKSKQAHDEIEAMGYIDSDIEQLKIKMEQEIINNIAELIINKGYGTVDDAHSKSCIVFDLMESFCHQLVYHKYKNINEAQYKEMVIANIVFSLSQ